MNKPRTQWEAIKAEALAAQVECPACEPAAEDQHECDFSYEMTLQSTTYQVRGFRNRDNRLADYPDGMTYAYLDGKEVMRIKGGFEDPSEARLLMIGYWCGKNMRPEQEVADARAAIRKDAITEELTRLLQPVTDLIKHVRNPAGVVF